MLPLRWVGYFDEVFKLSSVGLRDIHCLTEDLAFCYLRSFRLSGYNLTLKIVFTGYVTLEVCNCRPMSDAILLLFAYLYSISVPKTVFLACVHTA
jgi:hypothetical protein